MTSNELRQKYLEYFKGKDHKVIPSAPLVPENDPTTLFNSAGMQPLIPYLLGKSHPEGKRLVDAQKCLRTGDIDEVGDTYHHTFFEMLGNWSLGDYFKEIAIKYSFEFLTKELGISIDRIKVSVFEGNNEAPRDTESAAVWKSLGIPEDKILYLGKEDNWWSAGSIGPCGPDTEIFVDGIEIWNNVFMVYSRKSDGTLEELPYKNVDTGMGLERALTVLNGMDDNYQTDLFWPIIEILVEKTGIKYLENPEITKSYRIIVDHIKASIFLIKDGVIPSNKLQGYILRRLLRRAAVKLNSLKPNSLEILPKLVDPILDIYEGSGYFQTGDWDNIKSVISEELNKFEKTLNAGLKEFDKSITFGEVGKPETQKKMLSPKDIFRLYETYGFPYELSKEEGEKRGIMIPPYEEFELELQEHQQESRTASAGMFKGGLEDRGEETTKLHTATHLLHKVLRDFLGETVQQKGSNITAERLRFDFSFPEKLANEQLQEIEKRVNEKIKENLEVTVETKEKAQALKEGALANFLEKYPDTATVYSIGNFSKELCGGPHVKNTSELGTFKITKEESVSAGVRRIYATLH